MARALDEKLGGPIEINSSEPSWAERRRVFIKERDKLNYATCLDRMFVVLG